MKYLLSAILFGCLVLSARADKPEQKTDEVKPVKVPFTLMPTGHFLVSVKINDKGPYKLIFDTGAPTMLINNRIAKDSGVIDKKTSAPFFSPFGAMGPGMKAKTFEIGPLKAENVPLMVMDHPTVKAFSAYFEQEHGPIDGIVGFPFFARYKMVVDYQAKELTMTPNGYQPADIMESMMKLIMGGPENKGKPKIAAAAGQWGLIVDKEATDEEAGITIRSVMPGSAAEKAGLKEGDRMLTIDGRWTDSVGDTYQAAGYVKPGKAAPVVIKRDGKEMKLMVTPTNGL
jgi:membrane-associated protease RseP (regulator of RpoE activity)